MDEPLSSRIETLRKAVAWMDRMAPDHMNDAMRIIEELSERLAALPVSDGEPYGNHHYQSQFEQRANERMAQAYPTLAAFFSKYAIGPKVEASCFACGHTGERSITHLELPGVYVCETCVSKINAAPLTRAEEG